VPRLVPACEGRRHLPCQGLALAWGILSVSLSYVGEMSSKKGFTAARLFGNAVRGVKDVKERKLRPATLLKGTLARLTGRAAKVAESERAGGHSSFGPPASLLAGRRQGGRQVRGRGESAFEPTLKRAAAPAVQQRTRPALLSVRSKAVEAELRPQAASASAPGRHLRGFRQVAADDEWEDDEAPPNRTVSLKAGGLARQPRPSPADAPPRWQHDQFDGPKTIGSAVFVRNLPQGVSTAEQLAGIFGAAGQVASVQVDAGPLTTATIGFVRQDAANEAERRFHGRWLQGSQMKVSEGDFVAERQWR